MIEEPFGSQNLTSFEIATKIQLCKNDLKESGLPYKVTGIVIHPETSRKLFLESFPSLYLSTTPYKFAGYDIVLNHHMQIDDIRIIIASKEVMG